jgi:hypothetical protein
MFSNSFSWFLVNLAISVFWLAVAISTEQYFLALGSIFFIAIAMLVDLPASSSEEGSADWSGPLDDDAPTASTPLPPPGSGTSVRIRKD